MIHYRAEAIAARRSGIGFVAELPQMRWLPSLLMGMLALLIVPVLLAPVVPRGFTLHLATDGGVKLRMVGVQRAQWLGLGGARTIVGCGPKIQIPTDFAKSNIVSQLNAVVVLKGVGQPYSGAVQQNPGPEGAWYVQPDRACGDAAAVVKGAAAIRFELQQQSILAILVEAFAWRAPYYAG